MKYVWDQAKNKINQKKHKISFEEAVTVIESAEYAQIMDNTSDEHRFKAIGMSTKSRVLLVVYCYRDEDMIRIISARKATKAEVKIWRDVKK
jgi:uncharacterized DUF497 family protein